jgi:hypothetical protein
MDKLTKALGIALLIAGSVVYNGLIFSFFWKWFIVPVFQTNILTVGQSVGLSLFITYATMHKANENTKGLAHALWTSIVGKTILFGLGFIYSYFV